MRSFFVPGVLAVALLLAAISGRTHAADFQSANQLYDQGRFSEAKQHYEQLVEARTWSANLFYNLGNANYRLGAPGPAMLAYERALAIDPAHAEARANVSLLRRQSGARVWPGSWMDRIFPGHRVDIYAVLASAGGWLAIFCLAAIVFTPRGEKVGRWLGAVSGLLLAIYAGAALWHFGKSRHAAIVIASEAEARLAPAQSAGPAGTLPAGSQVRVLSERGDWIYCALPGAGRGWLPAGTLARIQPGET